MDPIDFHFDFASPYAWFAFNPLRRLAAEYGRDLRLRPMLLWVVLQQHGMSPPLEHAIKKEYMLHDMKRSARFYGLSFRMPDAFPASSHLPARVYLQLEQQDRERAAAFAESVFRHYFENNADLRSSESIVAIAAGLGIDMQWTREALASEQGRQLLRASNEAAVQAGAWGSPHMVVDGEAYFGADRLPQIEARLKGSLT